MAMKNTQANTIPIQVSDDGGTTWKTIVCISDHSLAMSLAVNKVNTQCGTAVGVGLLEFNPDFSAVSNITPGANEIGIKELTNYMIAETVLKYRIQNNGTTGSAGSFFYLSGSCMVTAAKLTETVGDVEKFTGTLTGIGIPSTVPGT